MYIGHPDADDGRRGPHAGRPQRRHRTAPHGPQGGPNNNNTNDTTTTTTNNNNNHIDHNIHNPNHSHNRKQHIIITHVYGCIKLA